MPAEAPLLLLRGDAGPRIGSGHVSRLLALARAWNASGGRSVLLTYSPSAALRAAAGAAGAELVELPAAHPDPRDLGALEAAVAASSGGKPWIAVDGYSFDSAYYAAVRAAGARVLAVDDTVRLADYPVDALLNQNPGAEAYEYPLPAEALALLGPRWALLSPDFADVGANRRMSPHATRLLVSFGGSDPADASTLAVNALKRLAAPPETVVVVGPDNPRADALTRLAAGLPVRIERAADMPALMAWADAGLIGGGVTLLEACAAGLPSLAATLAPNQEPGSALLAERGAVNLLGKADAISEPQLADALGGLLAAPGARESLAKASRTVVDGCGTERVVGALKTLSRSRYAPADIFVRRMEPADLYDAWRLANEAAVRKNSFSSAAIPIATHKKWFAEQITREDTRYWAIFAGDVFAAQARYVRQGDGSAEVHLAVRSAFHGKGLATEAFIRSGDLSHEQLGVDRLWAYVMQPNPGSGRALEKAGYVRTKEVTQKGRLCAIYEKRFS